MSTIYKSIYLDISFIYVGEKEKEKQASDQSDIYEQPEPDIDVPALTVDLQRSAN